MNELELKLGNREWITDYHAPGSVLYFLFYFFSNSYIHDTYPHDSSRVAFNLDNLRWGYRIDTCLLQCGSFRFNILLTPAMICSQNPIFGPIPPVPDAWWSA